MAGNAHQQGVVWTTRRLLAWMTEHFTAKGIDNPRLSAEMLLAHVLKTTRLRLYMEADRPADPQEREILRGLVQRAAAHEPVDYLVGSAPFFSMVFKVSPAVLIPRPSTETVVEHVLQHARVAPGMSQPAIADVGTGSGCIAISLARHLPEARVVATDISPEALAVARENAATHGVAERIDFRQGDLLEPLLGLRFDYLISNPPYISDAEWEVVERNVKDYEPTTALRSGREGLDHLRKLIAGAPDLLNTPGQVVLEFAASQKDAMLDLARADRRYEKARVLYDHEQLPRVLVAEVR